MPLGQDNPNLVTQFLAGYTDGNPDAKATHRNSFRVLFERTVFCFGKDGMACEVQSVGPGLLVIRLYRLGQQIGLTRIACMKVQNEKSKNKR